MKLRSVTFPLVAVSRARIHRWWLAPVVLLPLLLVGCSKDDETIAATEPLDAGADAMPLDASTDAISPDAGTKLTVVQANATSPAPVQLALQACAGLYNRKQGGSVFVELEAHDAVWVSELGITPDEMLVEADFLTRCTTDFPTCVRYDYATQQALMPNVLTVASVLGAVPLDDSVAASCGTVAFDATQVFQDKNTPLLATQYVFEQYASQTTGLAMLTPGYDEAPSDPSNPMLTTDMKPALVDFVFSQKLFVAYLVNGCVDGNPENALLSSIVNAGNWPLPLGVYGYNSTWATMGGDLYEAQTLCLDSRNMGAIASETGNLSYYATVHSPITDANVVKQNDPESFDYDPSKTYVAFVVGDGDNIGYLTSTRHDWFKQRISDCANAAMCPSLTWTISPHIAEIAPDLLRWYYDQSHQTKADYFALPPSGHLYAYPSSLASADQDAFVSATEEDARILGITGTVHWDWSTTWHDAETVFLPKYATTTGPIRGVFPVDVPYSGNAFPKWPQTRFFEVLTGSDGGNVVVFRPREWRGVDDDTSPFTLSPQKMADEIIAYPAGTVTWMYMTSDGGLSLENSLSVVVPLLPSNVVLVSTDTAARLAIAAGSN